MNAQAGDAPEIAGAGPAFAGLFAAIHAESFDAPWGEAEFARLLDLPTSTALVAGSSQAPAGFILLQIAGDAAEVLTIAVRPERRRGGVGRALLSAGLDAARRAGAASLILDVSEANAPARALYASLGFTEIARRKRYYADGADALVLETAVRS